MINVATDGETYGHHFKFGDLCLAHALAEEARGSGALITTTPLSRRTSPGSKSKSTMVRTAKDFLELCTEWGAGFATAAVKQVASRDGTGMANAARQALDFCETKQRAFCQRGKLFTIRGWRAMKASP
jgi:hypothetical protein